MRTIQKSYSLILFIIISISINTTLIAQKKLKDSSNNNITTISIEKEHSPRKATIYSMLLPGLGQIYNKKIWKVPIIYTLLGTGVYLVKTNTDQFNDFKTAFKDFAEFRQWKNRDKTQYPDQLQPSGKKYEEYIKRDLSKTSSRDDEFYEQSFKNLKNSYRRYRDMSYIGIIAVYALNIIDATVDAHLFNFNLNDDLSLRVEPTASFNFSTPLNNNLGAKLTLNF